MEPKSGGAILSVEWGSDLHEIVVSPRNWARIKRGAKLRLRASGYSECGSQWEYWNFEGGLEGKLVVEYGEDSGTGFDGLLKDADIEEVV
jgi:hypothetical protein